jgi:nicotinamide-nucleotide amidase
MRVEILSTGTELLRGRNVDTNAPWLGAELEKAGRSVAHHQTVGDDLGRLVDALKLAAARSDAVLMTGGLGPTEDDYTTRAVEEAFHRPLVFHPRVWQTIQERFRKRKIRMASINKRQAYAPRGAKLLPNPNGTAPGFWLREGGVFLAALPGPPREMKPMFLAHVLPRLRVKADFEVWEGRSFGLPEGTVDMIVRRIVGARAAYGLTVQGGQVKIAVRTEGSRRHEILRGLVRRLRVELGECGFERDLPEEVAQELIQSGTTVAIAESCTGGLVSHLLTGVPGVSRVLLESVVAYSNESKVRRLGVPEDLIRNRGAVSEEVAREMALGIARTSGARLGVAITGIAGPGGGTRDKPVGLCYMAVNDWVERRIFSGERAYVKERAATTALDMARLWMLRGRGHARKKVGGRGGR